MRVKIRLNILQLKRAKGMSQLKLSNLSGVSRSYINELENGKHTNPGVEIVCRLALALGCTLNELVECECEGGEEGTGTDGDATVGS